MTNGSWATNPSNRHRFRNSHRLRGRTRTFDCNRSSRRNSIRPLSKGVVGAPIGAVARVRISELHPDGPVESEQGIDECTAIWSSPAGAKVVTGNREESIRTAGVD